MTEQKFIENRRRLIKQINYKKLDELERGHQAWGTIGRGPKAYAQTFGLENNNSGQNYFRAWIEQIKENGQEPFGLDLFSTTDFLAKLGIDGIAVGLTDPRSESSRQADKDKRYQITGDLYTERKTIWKKIRAILNQRNLTGLDLITAAPVAGWGLVPEFPEFFIWHLEQMWQVLKPNGKIIVKIPWGLTLFDKDEVTKAWEKHHVTSSYDSFSHTLILTKTDQSPKSLIIKQLSSGLK